MSVVKRKVTRECFVQSCKNQQFTGCGVQFFTFPLDKPRRKAWIHFCRRADIVDVKSQRICMVHFSSDSFRPGKRKMLKDDAVPTLAKPLSPREEPAKTEERRQSARVNYCQGFVVGKKRVNCKKTVPELGDLCRSCGAYMYERAVQESAAKLEELNEEKRALQNSLEKIRKAKRTVQQRNRRQQRRLQKHSTSPGTQTNPSTVDT